MYNVVFLLLYQEFNCETYDPTNPEQVTYVRCTA